MKRFISFLILTSALFGIFSCNNNEKDFVNTTGLSISPSTLTLLIGRTAELTATVTPEDATSKLISWESSDVKVAYVDNFGRVTAMKEGTATITATSKSGRFTATCAVTVNPVPATSITLDKNKLELTEGDAETLQATVGPDDASDKSVAWSSSNPSVATVEAGKVTALVPGTATITATTKDGSNLSATCELTVKIRIPTEIEVVDVWKSDEAGYRAILGGSDSKSAGEGNWLTYDGATSVASWTANTTGKVRTAELEFTNGSKITVTQISALDFVGNWSFTGKTFASNKNLGVTAGNAYVANLTFAAKEGQTAMDGDRKITNNITIAGLINTYVAEGVVDIDYSAKTMRIGIFFDGENAQAVNTGKEGYGYIALLPELGNGWGSYNFCPVPFNNETNKGWLWLVTDSYNAMHYGKDNWLKCDGKDILGLSFCACKSAKPTVDDYNTPNKNVYDVIYQCNVNTKDNPGFLLERK